MRLPIRFRLRSLIVAVVVLSLAMAYVGSYDRLKRRGLREASDQGLPGFLYVPFEEAAASRSLLRHLRIAAFYAPLNWIDHHVFGGETPVICVMWTLSG